MKKPAIASAVAPRRLLVAGVVLSLGALLAGCDGSSSVAMTPPPPVAVIPQNAVGHYCGMFLFEHAGPKGQILLRDRKAPVWFTTIREVFAFARSPEEPRTIVAIYVQDMANMSPDGTFPEHAWIAAREAWYVIGSRQAGGMGARDALPFGKQAAADSFAHRHGGSVVRFEAMPEDYIFGDDTSPDNAQAADQPDSHHSRMSTEHQASGAAS